MNRFVDFLDQRSVRDDAAWRQVLQVADRTLCTPLLLDTPGLPAWFQDEIAARIEKNLQRRTALITTYLEAARALEQANVAFVLLKGFSHEVDAGVAPGIRTQGDIDLLCQPRDLDFARDTLRNCGFVFHTGSELSDNHLRPLLKPHSWQWRGDYFDPSQPVPVELHHSIWSANGDRIATPGMEAFWERRVSLDVAGLSIPAFCAVDRLAIAALHLLRHVLRNSVRPGHAWELASMLDRRAHDSGFWEKWHRLHPAPLRGLEATAFRFVSLWFGGEMPAAAQADWNSLPAKVHDWFERSAFAPLENLTRPNKDVLWLHLALLPKFTDRWAVARRRLVPFHIPGVEEVTSGSYLSHVFRRSRYHALALARALRTGSRDSTTRSNTSHTSD